MRCPTVRALMLAGLALALPFLSVAGQPPASGPLEPVSGVGCYAFGDDDTPAKAKKTAMALAQEQAVKSYRVYVQSASTVKNFQLEDDLIQSASAGMLQRVQIEKHEEKGREVCITITAKLSPVKMEELIQQKVKAKEVTQTAQTPFFLTASAFDLRAWINKQGTYVEGEPLIISVQSDRDAYLKLDYYQADGTVVHLVPNVYSGNAFIKAGQTYSFGGAGGSEAFTITGPFGAEAIKAIASAQPFDRALVAPRTSEESGGYLRSLQSSLRGVRVEAGSGTAAGSLQAQWAEASVGLTTTSKAAAEYNAATRGLRKR